MLSNELQPSLTPANLLNELMVTLKVKNDAGLAKALEIGPPMISKIRLNMSPVTPAILIVMHEATNISIRDLRFLMGDMRPHTGRSAGPAPVFERVAPQPRAKRTI